MRKIRSHAIDVNDRTAINSHFISWEILVLSVYGLLILMGGIQHEIWRDEAQSWLIARDIPLSLLFQQINYEGTPALWHLILMPFAKAGFPPETLTYIHLAIAFMAASIFIYKAPFSKLTKVAFLFSFYMAWEYAVIARNYNLTVLVVFAIAANYQNRFSRPLLHATLIFLLFNTNVHSFILAAGLAALYLYEILKEKIPLVEMKLPLAILVLGMVVTILQLIPAEDNMRGSAFYQFNYKAPARAVMNAFFPLSKEIESGVSLNFLLLLLAASSAIFGYALIYLFNRSRPVFLLFGFAISGLFFLFIFKHFGGYRHHGLILVFLLFALWIASYYPKPKMDKQYFAKWVNEASAVRYVTFALIFSLSTSVFMHVNEQIHRYSGAPAMAHYLETLKLSDQVLVGESATFTSSLAPYLPGKKFWYPEDERFGTYVVWNTSFAKNRHLSFQDLEERIKENNLDNENSLLLLNHKIPEENHHYQLLYKVDDGLFGPSNEQYYLYHINKKSELRSAIARNNKLYSNQPNTQKTLEGSQK